MDNPPPPLQGHRKSIVIWLMVVCLPSHVDSQCICFRSHRKRRALPWRTCERWNNSNQPSRDEWIGEMLLRITWSVCCSLLRSMRQNSNAVLVGYLEIILRQWWEFLSWIFWDVTGLKLLGCYLFRFMIRPPPQTVSLEKFLHFGFGKLRFTSWM